MARVDEREGAGCGPTRMELRANGSNIVGCPVEPLSWAGLRQVKVIFAVIDVRYAVRVQRCAACLLAF